jgi:hypothetical protein
MRRLLFLILTLMLSLGLDASECVSFEGVQNTKVVEPIIKELTLLGIKSKINTKSKCRHRVYLPIEVFIQNNSGKREIEVHLSLVKNDEEIDDKIVYIEDSANIYDLSKNPKKIKSLLIKDHSKIIAKNIQKELF